MGLVQLERVGNINRLQKPGAVPGYFPFVIFLNFIRGASCYFVDRSLGRENRTIHEITRTDTNKK
jgi:hypothetical protein